jgi:hypothetical protein
VETLVNNEKKQIRIIIFYYNIISIMQQSTFFLNVFERLPRRGLKVICGFVVFYQIPIIFLQNIIIITQTTGRYLLYIIILCKHFIWR